MGNKKNLREVLEKHNLWLHFDIKGERADLSGYDLSLRCLTRVNLRGAILRGTDFSGAMLFDADLSESDCTGACFFDADVRGANFEKANLTGAYLYCEYPLGTKWDGAILTDARGFGSWDEKRRIAEKAYARKIAAEKEE
jgi:uncharacterized protein YjbI with pentapeptide repeats